MAATGKTPILLYGSTTATNQPSAGNLTNSSDGCEIAINVADKNLFFKDSTNTVNTVPIRQSSASSDGWLSSTDWSTFNSKQPAGTYVTSVTGTAPVVSSGGTTPAISMAAATGSVNGYLTSTDWTTFNSKQAALVSGSNIKTVNGTTLLGSGDLGTIGVAYGGTGLTTLTAARIPYGNGTSAFNSSSTFTFDGTNLNLTNGLNTGFMYASTEVRVGSGWALAWGAYPSYAVNITGNTSTNVMTFVTNGTLRQTIGATGDITNHTGNFVVGTSGKGIDFSATPGTGTSELLADYEEGTWTPTLAGGTTAGDYALSSINAYYTKIGNQVTVNARFTVTVNSAGTGTAKFGGLPYAKGANQYIAGSVYSSGVTYAANIISLSIESWTSGSSSDFTITGVRSATTVSDLAVTNIASTNSFYMTFTYFV